MVAEGQSVNEFEEDAVRPKSDIDAEELAEYEINIDAVRPKSDLDAEAFDENAKKNKKEKMEQQQQKKYSKLLRKSQYKMWRSEGLLTKEEYCQR